MIISRLNFCAFAMAFWTTTGFAQSVQRGSDLDSPELSATQFGTSVSMPDDNTIAIGAPGLGGNGGVVVQVWNGIVWEVKGDPIIAPEDWISQGNNHGQVVSMPDADTFASSTHVLFSANTGPRTVTVEWNGSSWVQKGAVLNGLSVDMADSDHLVLFQEDESTGTVYPIAMEWDGSNWQPYGTFPENIVLDWGHHGRLSMPDAQTVAIGLPQTGSNSGSVSVFKLVDQNWNQVGETLEGEDNQDYFGWSISMPDANTLAVGARGASSTYVYTLDGLDWVQKGNTITGPSYHQYGYAVSMADPDHIAIGGPDSEGDNGLWQECGGVRVFQFNYEPGWSNSTWVTQNHPTIHGEGPNNIWGYSVSMPSPHVVAGGAPGNYGPEGDYIEDCGHARVYDLNFPTITNTVIPSTDSHSEIAVYPNPTQSSVCISGLHDGEVFIFNSTGHSIPIIPTHGCYDLGTFGSGIYLMKIRTSKSVDSHRVLVLPN